MAARTILHPEGQLKARVSLTRAGRCRVVLLALAAGTCITRWERGGVQASPNWAVVWVSDYDAPFHHVCDCAYEHVMASRRDALIIPL
jgi:hypothetical protein